VLNGVRRAVRDGHVRAADVAIYFFRGEMGPNGEPQTQIDNVEMNERGRVSAWPDGFFDQIEVDLDHIHSD
jgi:predicted ATPase